MQKKQLPLKSILTLRMRRFYHALDCIECFVGCMNLINFCIKAENDFRRQGPAGDNFTVEHTLKRAINMAWYDNQDLKEVLEEDFPYEVKK